MLRYLKQTDDAAWQNCNAERTERVVQHAESSVILYWQMVNVFKNLVLLVSGFLFSRVFNVFDVYKENFQRFYILVSDRLWYD